MKVFFKNVLFFFVLLKIFSPINFSKQEKNPNLKQLDSKRKNTNYQKIISKISNIIAMLLPSGLLLLFVWRHYGKEFKSYNTEEKNYFIVKFNKFDVLNKLNTNNNINIISKIDKLKKDIMKFVIFSNVFLNRKNVIKDQELIKNIMDTIDQIKINTASIKNNEKLKDILDYFTKKDFDIKSYQWCNFDNEKEESGCEINFENNLNILQFFYKGILLSNEDKNKNKEFNEFIKQEILPMEFFNNVKANNNIKITQEKDLVIIDFLDINFKDPQYIKEEESFKEIGYNIDKVYRELNYIFTQQIYPKIIDLILEVQKKSKKEDQTESPSINNFLGGFAGM